MPLPPLRPPTCEDLRCFVRGLLARRWIRFGIVGGAATLVYFFCGIAFVTLLGLPVLLGNALAYLAGFVVSYLGQCLWTFRAGIIWLLTRVGVIYEVAMWAAIVAVPVAVYFICKRWVFRS